MPADEPHRRRRRTKSVKTHVSTSHAERKNHELSASAQPETSERPATLEDLRTARLSYLATPHAERQRKMKYEYVKTVKVKEAVNTEPSKDGSTSPRNKHKSGKSRSRSSRSKPREEPEVAQAVEESQYVYGPSRQRERVPGAFEHDEQEDHREKGKTRSRSTKTARSSTTRRHTEPAVRQVSLAVDSNARNATRPQLRKSTTTVPVRPRSTRRQNSAPVIPESEFATGIAASPSTRKAGSVFGSLFTSKPQAVERKVSCLTCGDDVLAVRTVKLPCTHRMCHSCLKRIFKLAVTDPAHMPPRCCTDQPISLKYVDALFDQDFKKSYNRKFKEYTTKNKIYCPARGCGEWIQPKYIVMDKGRKIGRCPACKMNVCGICSQKMHKTRDCPKDPATKEFTEAAKQAGWQKCYSCSAMVELKEGCNHMTCRCTAEFCMMCGLKWKSCECPWFSYEQVDALGDPIRFQQEMERRREQEQHDEAIARRMAGLQLDDDDRPAVFEWFNFGNAAGRRRHQDFFQPARATMPMDHQRGHQADGELRHEIFPGHAHTPPAMPGGWDDGPQQFQQLPQVPRRHQRGAFDPAATDQVQPETAGPQAVPVVRHRTHRRRGTAPAAGPFEGRPLTAQEREQERQIRAWATGMP